GRGALSHALLEFRIPTLQRGFGPLPLRNVAEHQYDTDQSVFFVADGGRTIIDRHLRSVRPDDDRMVRQPDHPSFANYEIDRGSHGVTRLFIDNLEDLAQGASDDVLAPPTQYFRSHRIHERHDPGAVGGYNGVAVTFQRDAPACFAFIQSPLDAFLFRDIAP